MGRHVVNPNTCILQTFVIERVEGAVFLSDQSELNLIQQNRTVCNSNY